MEEMKISDGIQAQIELLESIYVPARELEIQGFPLMTAIKNLKMIKEAVVRAEKGVQPEESVQPEQQPEEEAESCTE